MSKLHDFFASMNGRGGDVQPTNKGANSFVVAKGQDSGRPNSDGTKSTVGIGGAESSGDASAGGDGIANKQIS